MGRLMDGVMEDATQLQNSDPARYAQVLDEHLEYHTALTHFLYTACRDDGNLPEKICENVPSAIIEKAKEIAGHYKEQELEQSSPEQQDLLGKNYYSSELRWPHFIPAIIYENYGLPDDGFILEAEKFVYSPVEEDSPSHVLSLQIRVSEDLMEILIPFIEAGIAHITEQLRSYPDIDDDIDEQAVMELLMEAHSQDIEMGMDLLAETYVGLMNKIDAQEDLEEDMPPAPVSEKERVEQTAYNYLVSLQPPEIH